jgi:hypothetical protein
MSGVPVGTLAMRLGSYSATDARLNQFYKLDGSRKLTGPMNANGNSMSNVSTLGATGNVTTSGGAFVANTPGVGVKIAGTQVYGDSSNIALRAPGGAYIQHTDGSWATMNAGTVNAYQDLGVWGTAWLNATNIQGNATLSGTTWLNGTTVHNGYTYLQGGAVVNSALAMAATAWAGYGCSGTGITTDPNGKILSCQGGVWQLASGMGQPFQVGGSGTCDWSAAIAQCPAGSKLVGGGYVLTWYSGSSFSHAPDGSYPDSANNRWILNGSGTNSCFASYANCVY